MSAADLLERVYAGVPAMACKGLCSDTCRDAIPVYGPELDAVTAAAGGTIPAPREDRVCPLLFDGRCSIYDHRPYVCRHYGAVDPAEAKPDYEVWSCPHGCRPERYLSLPEVLAALRALEPSSVRSLDPIVDARIQKARGDGFVVVGYGLLPDGYLALVTVTEEER